MTETISSPSIAADPLVLDDWTLHSRLFVGTGKYPDLETTEKALAISGSEVITVAIRRVDFDAEDHLMNHIDPRKYKILPNTAGCFNAKDAIRVAHISREACGHNKLKLEVLADDTESQQPLTVCRRRWAP